MSTYAIGIDIGGSHASGAIVNINQGQILSESYWEQSVNPHAPADEIIDIWHRLIRQIYRKREHLPIEKIGFAMPGPFDYKQGIGRFEGVPKFGHLNGVPVKKHLETILKKSIGHPFMLTFTNDATAFALSESVFGAAKGARRVWVLTLGTGLGSTFLADGQAVIQGEGLPPGGYLYDQPYRDRRADDYFSTRWFLEAYGDADDVRDIANRAWAGEKRARKVFEIFATHLADFLAPWIKQTQAERVVVAGGIAGSWELWQSILKIELDKRGALIDLRPGILGHEAPIIGAVIPLI